MSGTLNDEVLVLNKHWSAIRIINVERAIKAVFRERAEILDTETYNPHQWEGWAELAANAANGIKTSSGYVRKPEIIILTAYDKLPKHKIRVSRKNVYVRDRGVCQYTGRKLTYKESTIDHVIPTSKGGKNTFPNLALCAPEINLKKGNKTPEQAGLKLLRKPVEPVWSAIYTRIPKNPPKSWLQFLPELRAT